MHLIFLPVLFLITINTFAQNGDNPDYRSKKELFTRITEKEIRNDIASFSMGGIDESIGKLPLKTIPVTGFGDNYITFAENNIQVKITSAPFIAAKHKLGYTDGKYLAKIDNKPYFGDYGKVPKKTIESVTVVIDKDTISVPPSALTDLHNINFSFYDKGVQKTQDKVYLSADGRRIYVYVLKPEEGGSYEVTWVIQDKKYIKRVVDFGFLK